MDTFELTAEIFQIPWEGQFILYAPLKRWVLLVNEDAVNVLADLKAGRQLSKDEATQDFLGALVRAGLVNGQDDNPPPKRELSRFEPTSVILFPTSDCNLRCVYCYAEGGARAITMDWSVAKAAIDWTMRNCCEKGMKSYDLGFHGGGEPAVAWEIMVRSVEYARNLAEKHGLRFSASTPTNGILGSNKFEWMIRNISHFNLSWDGPPDIQDVQRPFPNGRGSSKAVLHTVERFREENRIPSIRATVSQYSVHRMKEMVDYMFEKSGSKNLHFEPLFSCGRCAKTQWESPEAKEFAAEFLKARARAEELGIDLYYSGQRVENITCAFCGAAGTNFSVTPEGYITSCHEVCLLADQRSRIFFYGRYDANSDSFEVWEDRRKYLLSHTVHNIDHCSECFLKWHCAGDCLAKVAAVSGLDASHGTPRCYINQTLAMHELSSLLDGRETQRLQPLAMDIQRIGSSLRTGVRQD